MRFVDVCEDSISQVYVCAVIYGDYSGLEAGEDQLVEDWIRGLGAGPLHYDFGETTEFALCAISGLMADCVTVKVTKVEEA